MRVFKNPDDLHTRSFKKPLVEAPDEIDLETITWIVGRLEIQYGGLKDCDGRILTNSTAL